jgi:hypothetical protein
MNAKQVLEFAKKNKVVMVEIPPRHSLIPSARTRRCR